jgi:hypothetical protein
MLGPAFSSAANQLGYEPHLLCRKTAQAQALRGYATMNERELLLQCLAEEGTEIAHAVSKCLRFGMDDEFEGRPPNHVRLKQEINDLVATLLILREKGILPKRLIDINLVVAKKKKLLSMIEYSRSVGVLAEDTLREQLKHISKRKVELHQEIHALSEELRMK